MESSALLPGGTTRAECPRALFLPGLPAMSCFPQLWRSSTPDSPSTPGPGSPAAETSIPISPTTTSTSPTSTSPTSTISPILSPSSSPTGADGRRKGRSPLGSPSSPGSPKPASPVECSICFNTYDNTFKTPKLLQCQHVFCLECVARLSTALPPHQAQELLPCPFCRQLTQIPQQGAPGLATSKELLATLPPELQQERPLWMEGTRLCCRRGSGDSDNPEACVSIDVAMSKAESAQAAAQGLPAGWARCQLCQDWKRIVLLSALLIILFCIILWPVQCALKTGNLRCLARPVAISRPEYLPPKATAAGAAVTRAALH